MAMSIALASPVLFSPEYPLHTLVIDNNATFGLCCYLYPQESNGVLGSFVENGDIL